MTIKKRLAQLEKQTQQAPKIDPYAIRKINYRSGIIEGVNDEPPDAIPLRIIEVNNVTKEQNQTT